MCFPNSCVFGKLLLSVPSIDYLHKIIISSAASSTATSLNSETGSLYAKTTVNFLIIPNVIKNFFDLSFLDPVSGFLSASVDSCFGHRQLDSQRLPIHTISSVRKFTFYCSTLLMSGCSTLFQVYITGSIYSVGFKNHFVNKVCN